MKNLVLGIVLVCAMLGGCSKVTHVKDLKNVITSEVSEIQRLVLMDTINNLYGIALIDSTIIIHPEYKHIELCNNYISDTLFILTKANGKEVLYSFIGNVLIEDEYDDISILLEGKDLIIAKNKTKKAFTLELSNGNSKTDSIDLDFCSLYNIKGEKLLNEEYNNIYWHSGMLFIKKRKVVDISSGTYEDLNETTYGIISKTGEILVPCEYREIEHGNRNYKDFNTFVVCKDENDPNSKGLYIGKELVIPCEYNEIKSNKDNTGAVLIKSLDKKAREISVYVTELPNVNPVLIYSGRAAYLNGGDPHEDYVYCRIYTPGSSFKSKRFSYNGEEIPN